MYLLEETEIIKIAEEKEEIEKLLLEVERELEQGNFDLME